VGFLPPPFRALASQIIFFKRDFRRCGHFPGFVFFRESEWDENWRLALYSLFAGLR
jgi:hypothetical protein